MSLHTYLSQVSDAIDSSNGKRLRDLFRLDSDAGLVAMQAAQRGTNISYNEVSRQLGGQWADVVAPFLQALVAVQKGDRLQACQTFREKHCRVLMDMLGVESWVAPALSGAATTLKELSVQADGDSLKRGGHTSNSQLAACAMMLQQMFSKTAAAKGQDASYKKARAVAIGCVMLKTYFRLSTITNCKNVIQTIDNVLKVFDQAEAAHRVTYRYYTGRLLTYDERFQEADEHLTYAFKNCDPSSHNNKRRILKYLIPVRMLLGILPSDQLLAQYKLTEYADIAAAMRMGDVGLLMRCMDANQLAFVQAGTYLLLEKLQLATYRRLIKKCALLHAQANPGPKSSQVPIPLFQRALELQGIQKDDAEMQCLLANLIYRKFIKGYVAYRSRVVVLAKTDAFPDLKLVHLADPFSLS